VILKAYCTQAYTVGPHIFNRPYACGPDSPADYRPILLTCISCKVFEHITFSNIYHNLSVNNILCEQQKKSFQFITAVDDFTTHLNV